MRRFLTLLAAVMLLLTTVTPAEAFHACNPGRGSIAGTGYVKLIQPSGAPGSTWFLGVEGDVYIQRPFMWNVVPNHTRYGVQIVYNLNGQSAVAQLEYQWVTATGGYQLRLHAKATDYLGSVIYDNWWNRSGLATGSEHELEIDIGGSGEISFRENNTLLNTVWHPFTWKGTSVQAYGVVANRGNQMVGSLSHPAEFNDLQYTTQYGTATWASGATYFENSHSAYFGQSEPSSGVYRLWDKGC